MIETSGKNIILRTMNQKEIRALFRKCETEEGKQLVYDEAVVDKFFQKISERAERSPSVGIFTKNDEIIGQLTFENVVYSEKRCDLVFFFANSSYEGKGYEQETVLVAKKYAKEQMGLKKMYAEVSSKKLNLQKVLKECGFNHTKTFKGNAKDGGDVLVFFAVL